MQALNKHLRNLLIFQCVMSWTVCNKYICEIYIGSEMHKRYARADTLLSTCYCWRPKFMIKIDMKIYFRYTLFRSPWCYFWCTAGARFKGAPEFSCPESNTPPWVFFMFFLKKYTNGNKSCKASHIRIAWSLPVKLHLLF